MVNLRIGFLLFCALLPRIGVAQSQGSAVVSGIVTDAVTHLPILGASVYVGAVETHTDSDGTYELSAEPGRFRIQAIRGGYMKGAAVTEIELRPGDSVRHDFELHPSPRIAGTITDADTGEPVKGCLVFAMRRISSMGESWYTSAGIPTADSRNGTFATVSLEPGDYILEINDCAWTFYPGVSRIEMATPLTVTEAGINALTIKLRTRDIHRVSGVAEHGAVDIRLVRHIHDVAQTLIQVRADASGHFEFPSVPEGEFHLVTSAGAHRLITVTDHDLTDLNLKAAPSTQPRITVLVDDVVTPLPAELVPVFDREPGPQWLRVTGVPRGSGIATMLVNNLPLPNGSIMVDGALTVVITSKTGTLTGTLDSKHAAVVAIREPFVEFLDQSTLPRARVENKSDFEIKGLAPGKYKVVALTGEEELLERNEAFLRKKAAQTESVEITAGTATHVAIK
jgi:hypothetical protein